MIKVPLANTTHVALIDDEDWPLVQQYKWHIAYMNGNMYAHTEFSIANGQTRKVVSLHRLIMGIDSVLGVDHKDHNGLNCVRSNMRFATVQQNAANSRIRSDNRSTYKGVCRDNKRRKWRASIQVNGMHKHLGYFDNVLDAASAYDEAAKEVFGEFAYRNIR